MPPRKQRPPITYANTLDRPKPAKIVKQAPSPSSSIESFNGAMLNKAKQYKALQNQVAVSKSFVRPKIDPAPHPKGISSKSVDASIHYMRLRKAQKAAARAQAQHIKKGHRKSRQRAQFDRSR